MALRWFLHSACHVLGYQNEPNNLRHCKSSKVSSNCDPTSSRKVKQYPDSGFQMPLHYPRYTKSNYEKMEEWKVDLLLREYGLNLDGSLSSLDEKRAYAMGAFLWPDQH
ncbi:hypothetical protein F3Y22_tig00110933pilonHSYRG00244 [Hibiscus syriacus]|uniref:DUF7722 domain-containing protein n=1 Tax=Hibiscus syriacus TaxID=106335 RepID=A0A6A2ZCJ4_HIBSY|nr:uncharacterized protein LOC120146971 [Hibiscus syriacus]KAE8689658.1 hypothetical protein F3Y22_tig00110933pilonHSYRG00244 [Hibiscus syriacus]